MLPLRDYRTRIGAKIPTVPISNYRLPDENQARSPYKEGQCESHLCHSEICKWYVVLCTNGMPIFCLEMSDYCRLCFRRKTGSRLRSFEGSSCRSQRDKQSWLRLRRTVGKLFGSDPFWCIGFPETTPPLARRIPPKRAELYRRAERRLFLVLSTRANKKPQNFARDAKLCATGASPTR